MGFAADHEERLLDPEEDPSPKDVLEDVVEAFEDSLKDYWAFLGDLFSDAASVVIAWSWSDVIYRGFSELESELKSSTSKFDVTWTPDAFALLYAIIISGLAALLVTQADAVSQLSKQSFLASCRTLLLICAPILVGWAWKDFLSQTLWDSLEHRAADETMLMMLRLGFALGSTLAVVLLTNAVNELFPTNPTKQTSTYMGIRYHGLRWNMLRMVSKSLSVFVSWCWDALAKQSGVMTRNDISESDDWSRGVYAAFVTLFFTYTTYRNMKPKLPVDAPTGEGQGREGEGAAAEVEMEEE